MTAINWQWFVAPGSALYLLPLALLAGIAILARGTGGRAVLVWWAAILVVCLLTAASKISFYGWGTGIRAWDLTCFSGHTVISFCVWPVVGMLLLSPSSRVLRVLGLLAGISLATVIGYSRIPLGAHPVSEVVAGLLLGALAGGIGAWALRRENLPGLFAPGVGLLLLATTILPMGPLPTLPSERWFAAVGATLSGREAPWNRKSWKVVTGTTNSRGLHLRG